jgi:hypothetical protein
LTFEMQSAQYDRGGWIYEIFNPGLEFLRGDYCKASQCQDGGFTATTGISGRGAHYVRIRSAIRDEHPVGEYTFRVTFSDDTSGIEFEPNDEIGLAQTVSWGEPITGAVSGIGDEDMFVIELNEASPLELSFTAVENHAAGYNIAVYDPQGSLLKRTNCILDWCRGVRLSTDGVSGGRYSILITSGSTNSFPSGEYTFTATATDATPPAPAGLSASYDEFSDRIGLSWNATEGAVSYQLMRGTSASNISETIYSGAVRRFVILRLSHLRPTSIKS